MYTGKHAHLRPLQPAFIMAGTGEAVTYRRVQARSNRLAHLFRNRGLRRLDHYAIFMENNSRYLEACGAGERSRVVLHLHQFLFDGGELAYILANSESRVLITSAAKLDIAREALKECPKIELCIVADGAGESERIVGLQEVTRGLPETPIADEYDGTATLYSSGTTAGQKHCAAAARAAALATAPLFDFLQEDLAVSRRHDLSFARAALSFGSLGRRRPHDPRRRHGHHHGEVRPERYLNSSRNGASPTASWCRRCFRAC